MLKVADYSKALSGTTLLYSLLVSTWPVSLSVYVYFSSSVVLSVMSELSPDLCRSISVLHVFTGSLVLLLSYDIFRFQKNNVIFVIAAWILI